MDMGKLLEMMFDWAKNGGLPPAPPRQSMDPKQFQDYLDAQARGPYRKQGNDALMGVK